MRRAVLALSALSLVLSACGGETKPVATAGALASDDPEVLWKTLMEGNARWRGGKAVHPRQDAGRRGEVATKQNPKVVVLACADSRVSPEVVFDQGLGDLFVVRVAGNVATPEVEASIEYAAEHLGARLVVVMGHERCGAVTAALAGGEAPGHLPALLSRLKPAVDASPAGGADRTDRAIAANARLSAEGLAGNEVLAHLHTAVRAAVYDLDTGEVTAIPLSPAPAGTPKAH
jgi:carbonic anhydrase